MKVKWGNTTKNQGGLGKNMKSRQQTNIHTDYIQRLPWRLFERGNLKCVFEVIHILMSPHCRSSQRTPQFTRVSGTGPWSQVQRTWSWSIGQPAELSWGILFFKTDSTSKSNTQCISIHFSRCRVSSFSLCSIFPIILSDNRASRAVA